MCHHLEIWERESTPTVDGEDGPEAETEEADERERERVARVADD